MAKVRNEPLPPAANMALTDRAIPNQEQARGIGSK